MIEIIKSKSESCTGCNRCVRECPMEMANVTYRDKAGNIKVKIDHEKCIGCGRCVLVCKHDARCYEDDTEKFFDDLSKGIPISLMVAPSVRTNIPDCKKLFTYLKQIGVNKIYDVSLGADICIWAHIMHLDKNENIHMITQPCPAIVTYCEIYCHDLLKRLSPIHSPMACTAVYMKKYQGINDRIAALSPCIAKKNEFEDTKLAQYNITFSRLLEYLNKNNIVLPVKETEFDHDEVGLGSLFPLPGGLKENIEYCTGKKFHIAKAEGFSVYEKLNKYTETPEDFLPEIFDVLSCEEGCNIGSACSRDRNVFEINKAMDTNRRKMTEDRRKEYYESIYKTYSDKFDLSHFIRKYQPVFVSFPSITNADISKAFDLLDKTNYEKQNVDCGACGSATCYDMARRIALGVNIPINCMLKVVGSAKEEHAVSLGALEQFETIWNYVESGIMLIDAETRKIIDVNPAAVRMFGEAKEKIIGEHCSKFFKQDECPLLDLNQAVDREERKFTRSDGVVFPIIKTATKTRYNGRHVFLESFNDITHIKEAENQKLLIELGERIQLMLSSNPQANILFDSNFKVMDCNPAACELMGFESREDLFARFVEHINDNMPEFLSDGRPSIGIVEGLMTAAKTGKKKFNAELHIKDVIRFYDVEMKKIPYGNSFAIVVYISDVTDSREYQKELVHARELNELQLAKMNLMIKAAGIALWDMDVMKGDPVSPENPFIWTDDFRRMLGFSDEKDFPNILNSWIKCLHPEDKDRVISEFAAHILDTTGKIPYDTECRLIKKNGECGYFHACGKTIRDKNGNPVRVAGALLDITEPKKRVLNHELRLILLNTVVEATKIGLWDMEIVQGDLLNPENVFTYSDDIRHMLGYIDENDFPNLLSSWLHCIHPEDNKIVMDAFEKHLMDKSGNTPYEIEYRMFKKTGECIYFRDSGKSIRDGNGNPIRIAGALLDVTKSKNIINEAEKQRMVAEAANKAKSSFLSTMSHEIRTPMNAILGITDIQLQDETLPLSVKEALEKIYTSGDLLLGIINDILDLSKIEAGKMDLAISKYEISSLVSDTVQLNMMRIGNKSIEFELCIDENTPTVLLGDELRVKQILNNLLSNAFKYTMTGTVRLFISAETIDNNDDKIYLVVKVSDTGQGMSQDQIDKLFVEYARFNQEANRSTEGTGLGMSITHNLVRLMDGAIFIESELGKGSVFTVRLPQIKVSSELLGKEGVENLRRFRTISKAQMKRVQISREPMPYGSVLIVDDVETNIYVAKGLMSPYKLKIDSAESGFLAIEKVRHGSVYDIIFMDHMMAGMDGIEATKTLRDMGYHRPVVALTANAVAGQEDIFLANGFDDFISKPIDIRQLNAVLNKFIRDKQPPEIIKAAKEEAEQKKGESSGKALQSNLMDRVIDSHFIEIFVRDTLKVLTVLEGIAKENDYSNEDNMRAFIINVHGIKSALANIGKSDLSALALKLEMAGRGKKIEIITSETPAFLRSLQTLIEDLSPQKETNADESADEDIVYLNEMLLAIKTACGEYDGNNADKTLVELRKMTWSPRTRELLGKIAEQLLHSDFDEVINTINEFVS